MIGPGCYERVYEELLYYELNKTGLNVKRQITMPITYEVLHITDAYKLDLLIEDKVIIEIKSVENLAEVHHKQVITYLKLSGLKLGLLVNFNSGDISKSIFRKVNGL